MRIPHSALRQRMTVEEYQGEGARGSTFAAPVTGVPASIQATASMTVDWKDEEIVVNTMVLIRPEDGPIDAGSRVTINGDAFRVIKCFPIPDAFRPSHYELMVRSWGSQ